MAVKVVSQVNRVEYKGTCPICGKEQNGVDYEDADRLCQDCARTAKIASFNDLKNRLIGAKILECTGEYNCGFCEITSIDIIAMDGAKFTLSGEPYRESDATIRIECTD